MAVHAFDETKYRLVVDVTTKWQKRVDAKARMATALGFALFVLMVSPRDQRFFYFVAVRPDARSVRVPFELLREMERVLRG